MKTEMVNVTNSAIIGGNLVQLDNKNRYHITDKNGKKKILSQDQFKRNLDANYEKQLKGEDFKFKKTMSPLSKTILTIAGLAAAVTGFIYRKDIKNFFKTSKIKQTLDNMKNSESGQKINETVNAAKEKVNDIIKNPKKYATKADEVVAKGTEKAINGLAKIVDFFANFRKK